MSRETITPESIQANWENLEDWDEVGDPNVDKEYSGLPAPQGIKVEDQILFASEMLTVALAVNDEDGYPVYDNSATSRVSSHMDHLLDTHFFAKKAFEESGLHLRRSGDHVMTHAWAIVLNMINYKITDLAVLDAFLLHDVVEDTAISLDQIKERFGSDTSELVDSLTKINSSNIQDTQLSEVDAQLLAKFPNSNLKDLTIHKRYLVFLKNALAPMGKAGDVLHNTSTMDADHLKNLSQTKYLSRLKKLADATRHDAVFADKIGLRAIGPQIRSNVFKILYPERAEKIQLKAQQSFEYLQPQLDELSELIWHFSGIESVHITSPEIYSINQRMEQHNLHVEDCCLPEITATCQGKDQALTLYQEVLANLGATETDRSLNPFLAIESKGYLQTHLEVYTHLGQRLLIPFKIQTQAYEITPVWKLNGSLLEGDSLFNHAWKKYDLLRKYYSDASQYGLPEELLGNLVMVQGIDNKIFTLSDTARVIDFAAQVHSSYLCKTKYALIPRKGEDPHREISLDEPLQEGDRIELVEEEGYVRLDPKLYDQCRSSYTSAQLRTLLETLQAMRPDKKIPNRFTKINKEYTKREWLELSAQADQIALTRAREILSWLFKERTGLEMLIHWDHGFNEAGIEVNNQTVTAKKIGRIPLPALGSDVKHLWADDPNNSNYQMVKPANAIVDKLIKVSQQQKGLRFVIDDALGGLEKIGAVIKDCEVSAMPIVAFAQNRTLDGKIFTVVEIILDTIDPTKLSLVRNKICQTLVPIELDSIELSDLHLKQ